MIGRLRGTLAAASTLLLALVSWTTASPQGAHAAPFAAAIETLARKLEADYVFPAVGAQYAAALRGHLAAGDYDGITDAGQVAARLTADLQATRWEGHLRVRVAGAAPSSVTRASADAPPPIKAAKWIAPGVAYIAFTLMPDDPQVVSATDRFMREHASARALIIDARALHGGGEGVPSAIFRYLYAKRQVVAYFDSRPVADNADDDPYEQPPTVTTVAGPPGIERQALTVIPDATEHRLFRAKVFYLTSRQTASVAEQIAEILKRTHRGAVVGERTFGAGHFGFYVPIGQGLEAYLTWGRVLDPVTGEDYEGRGVTPDVAVPADQALDTALRMASR
jgi:C-terminal processing protease CtpA/Prc